jgi:hypothetical protein
MAGGWAESSKSPSIIGRAAFFGQLRQIPLGLRRLSPSHAHRKAISAILAA